MLTYPGQQRLRRAADLGGDGFNGRPLRRMIAATLRHHTHGALTNFGENFTDFFMALSSQELEPPPNPGASNSRSVATEDRIGLIKPAIWRRIVVPESIALGNLHQVLQITFDWCDYHLHEFDLVASASAFPTRNSIGEPVCSETRIQLKTALGGMASFKYVHDFGDHWEHRIKVEKKLPGDPQLSQRAMLLKAANAAPRRMSRGTRLRTLRRSNDRHQAS